MTELSDYPIDDDYIGVDNWDPSSELGREQKVDVDEIDSSISAETADGALSAAKAAQDAENIIVNDGRSITRTTFWPSDVAKTADPNRSKLERLAALNDGERSPDRPRQNSVADKSRIIDIFCGYCEVPYRDRVNYLYDHFDMSRKGSYSYEEVILAIISLVCQSNGRFVRNESNFIDLMDVADMTHSDLWSCKNTCRTHFDRADVSVGDEWEITISII